MVLATGDWVLLHQVTVRRHDTDLLPGQSDEPVSSDWAVTEKARAFISKTRVTKCTAQHDAHMRRPKSPYGIVHVSFVPGAPEGSVQTQGLSTLWGR